MRRRRAAAGVDRGDSSSSSAESSFRELDDSFLQTQTRIWLEEVLETKLDEDMHVSDLLQDGEILFELSKVVWNLLLTKCPELRYLKGRFGPFGSKKSSGKYRPYSNVDLFLKICKIMGLKGIDLFSPSDVVEKRDNRKVCTCIRAFSKKARSKQLSVPDFDMVMCSVSMPKDMVGCIRRSLELSQSTVSSSSSSPKDSRSKLRQKKLHTPSDRDDDSCSDESDEAESRYMSGNYFPNASKFDNAEVNSVLENNHQFDTISSFGVLSRRKPFLCGRNDAFDVVDSNFTSETGDSVVGDSSCISGDESSYIADYLAFSDLMVHETNDRNLAFLNGENKMFDFFLNPDSQGKNSDTRNPYNGCGRKFSDDDETEVSSTTSMTSVLCRVLNLELDDQYDTEHEFDKQYQEPLVSSGCKKSGTFEASLQVGLFDSLEAQSETAISAKYRPSSQSVCQELDKEFLEVESFGSCAKSEEVTSCMDNSGLVDTEASLIYENKDSVTVIECKQEKNEDIPAETSLNERSNASHGIPWKLGRKPLLKMVFKGTAIAGVFFLLIHINGRTSGGNNALATKEYAQAKSKFPSKKPQISRVNGIYPAERIKL
ncbi:uncharacterized protein LOC142518665 isoform X1 [Primulina tabacum]|uniref:uncharacterized protein LOC142518665 isoform X1 n=2 Tax=Primulina tabacum TaxID=48773 RepID=UPI003F5A066C